MIQTIKSEINQYGRIILHCPFCGMLGTLEREDLDTSLPGFFCPKCRSKFKVTAVLSETVITEWNSELKEKEKIPPTTREVPPTSQSKAANN